MNETMFTAGPWVVHDGNVYQAPLLPTMKIMVKDENAEEHQKDYQQGMIAIVYPQQRATQSFGGVYDVMRNKEANAALISAAPELLEGCREAVSCTSINSDVRDMILAAIAKAEGRRIEQDVVRENAASHEAASAIKAGGITGSGAVRDGSVPSGEVSPAIEMTKAFFGLPTGNPSLFCPHCQTKGHVTTTQTQVKTGISGGKATAAILTLGLSLVATGLSRKQVATKAHCSNCNSSWMF